MFVDMGDKLGNDEVLSDDPVLKNFLAKLNKIVMDKCSFENKLIKAFHKEYNQLMDEMDAGPAFKK